VKRILRLLLSKTFIVGIFFLMQLFFLFFIIKRLIENDFIGIYFQTFFAVISFFTVFHILTSKDNPTYKIAWLIPVLSFPVFGTAFYVFYHGNNITKKTVNKYMNIISKRLPQKNESNFLERKGINFLHKNGWQSYINSSTKFLASGIKKLENLIIDLKNAKKFIFLEYFILADGIMLEQILDVLIEKASQGVEVKILYDDFGCAGVLSSKTIKKIKKSNIDILSFNRMKLHINFGMNYRNHRKIVVIDNKIAYTGGINIGDEYLGLNPKFKKWHDAAVRIEGAAVWSLTLSFLETWNFSIKTSNKLNYNNYYSMHKVESDEIILPFSDSPIEKNNLTRNLYLHLINSAKKEILITTPYLIFDNEIFTSLKFAANSGIDVKIVIPKIADKKLVYLVTESYALDLIKEGVKIYKYSPGFIHSKLMVIDNKRALIGTTNLDFRSLYLHFENNIYLYESKTIDDIKNFILDAINESNLETYDSLFKKKLILRLLQATLKGFAPIL